MCLYSVPSACALCNFRDRILFTAKCALESKLDANKHAAKLHFSLVLMGGEFNEEGRKVEPVTITNSDLKVCPLFNFHIYLCLMLGPTLVEPLSLTFHWLP